MFVVGFWCGVKLLLGFELIRLRLLRSLKQWEWHVWIFSTDFVVHFFGFGMVLFLWDLTHLTCLWRQKFNVQVCMMSLSFV